jgi:protein TonB
MPAGQPGSGSSVVGVRPGEAGARAPGASGTGERRDATARAPSARAAGASAPAGAGDAEALALAVPGAGGQAVYGPYLAKVRGLIHEGLRYPMTARRRGLAGTVQLEVLILPTGAIGSARVVESSSHDVLDAAALDAVRQLAPVPFPPEVAPRSLRVRLPVVFALQ